MTSRYTSERVHDYGSRTASRMHATTTASCLVTTAAPKATVYGANTNSRSVDRSALVFSRGIDGDQFVIYVGVADDWRARFTAFLAVLTGAYHLSRRQAIALVHDLTGMKLSLGVVSHSERRVSEALVVPVAEAHDKAREAPVKHIDETGWVQAAVRRSLWTIATTLEFRQLTWRTPRTPDGHE